MKPLLLAAVAWATAAACGQSADVVASVASLHNYTTLWGLIVSTFGQPCSTTPPPVAVWDSWPMAFHDQSHSGRTTDVVTPPLSVLWRWADYSPYDLGHHNGIASLPLVGTGDQVCFIAGMNANRFLCLRASTRTPLWESDNGLTYAGSPSGPFQRSSYPAISGSRMLWAGSDYTTSLGLDGTGGVSIYNTNGGWPGGGIAISATTSKVYQQFAETDVGSEDVVVFPVAATLASPIRYVVSGSDNSLRVPSVDDTVSQAYATVSGVLTAINTVTGQKAWSATGVASGSPAVSPGMVYCKVGSGFNAYHSNGSVAWSMPLAASVYGPIVYGGVVYIPASDGNFMAVNASNGSLIWSFKTGPFLSPDQFPMISGGLVFVPTPSGVLYFLNTSNGSVAGTWSGVGALGPVIESNGIIFVSESATGYFYALKPARATPGF